MFARQRLPDKFFFSLFDRIGEGNAQDGCSALIRLPDDAFDFRQCYERPHSIVNGNEGRSRLQVL